MYLLPASAEEAKENQINLKDNADLETYIK